MRSPSRHPSRRPGGFQPPQCPNPDCPYHQPRPDWHFVRNGWRRRSGRRPLQAYLCRHCGRSFSAVTFTPTYWLRKPHLLLPVATLVTEGAGLRQAARALHTSHTTVMRHLARLARHCLLTHTRLLAEHPVPEPLVFDGFESFAHSQFFPFHANLAVGASSWMLYHFTVSPLRRKGTMTPGQRRKRDRLEQLHGRADPKAVERGIEALLRPFVPRLPPPARTLHSDDHPAYRRALRRLRRQGLLPADCRHLVTSSKVRRTQKNPLFPVNLADLLLRHGSANHRRETIAFSKSLQGAVDRLAVFTVWRNYVKKRREKASGSTETAAVAAGVIDRPLSWREILKRRCFPTRIALLPEWNDFYLRRTPATGSGWTQAEHALRYAF